MHQNHNLTIVSSHYTERRVVSTRSDQDNLFLFVEQEHSTITRDDYVFCRDCHMPVSNDELTDGQVWLNVI